MTRVGLSLGSRTGGSHTDTEISASEHVSAPPPPFFSQKTKKPKVAESLSKSDVSEGKMLKEVLILAKIRP